MNFLIPDVMMPGLGGKGKAHKINRVNVKISAAVAITASPLW